MAAIEFAHGGGVVGYFDEPAPPRSPGHFRYVPYRSASHLMLQTELAASRVAECEYLDADRTVRFRVVACPEYGVLEILDFIT